MIIHGQFKATMKIDRKDAGVRLTVTGEEEKVRDVVENIFKCADMNEEIKCGKKGSIPSKMPDTDEFTARVDIQNGVEELNGFFKSLGIVESVDAIKKEI